LEKQAHQNKKRPVRRYLLFSNVYGYPDSGWDAFGGDYENLAKAQGEARKVEAEGNELGVPFWWHIVDIKKREVVSERS
jgi:hypothetical protein